MATSDMLYPVYFEMDHSTRTWGVKSCLSCLRSYRSCRRLLMLVGLAQSEADTEKKSSVMLPTCGILSYPPMKWLIHTYSWPCCAVIWLQTCRGLSTTREPDTLTGANHNRPLDVILGFFFLCKPGAFITAGRPPCLFSNFQANYNASLIGL